MGYAGDDDVSLQLNMGCHIGSNTSNHIEGLCGVDSTDRGYPSYVRDSTMQRPCALGVEYSNTRTQDTL